MKGELHFVGVERMVQQSISSRCEVDNSFQFWISNNWLVRNRLAVDHLRKHRPLQYKRKEMETLRRGLGYRNLSILPPPGKKKNLLWIGEQARVLRDETRTEKKSTNKQQTNTNASWGKEASVVRNRITKRREKERAKKDAAVV